LPASIAVVAVAIAAFELPITGTAINRPSTMSVVPSLAYSRTAGIFHWLVALPLIGCVGSVLQAQQAPKEEKGMWMHRHKSLGLLTAGIVAPRLLYRLLSRSSYNVRNLEGNASWENVAGTLSHYALYAFMIIMPGTGIAMGYYGGKGLPFFNTTFAGAEKPDGAIAKNAFNVHKQVGTYGKYLIPLHIGASGMHWARGQQIFSRINPFRTPRA
jgi:cytochrome b561